jgi:hypothetical protein
MMAKDDVAIIFINMLDWWLGGTGETETGGADKNAYRDEWGCPALPASQVKGTLRETAELWAGWTSADVAVFFCLGTGDAGAHDDSRSREGALGWGPEAGLPLSIRKALEGDSEKRARLFSRVPATAINPLTGTALDTSLRQIEVVVPMQLTLEVRWLSLTPQPDDWIEKLDQLCALTPSFGALKQDGFGRCVASCKAVSRKQGLAA